MAERKLKGGDPKSAKPSRPKILIFGKSGVGKTWNSIDFPLVYYIDTEGGADLEHYTDKLKKAGGAYFGREDGSLDFNAVIEEVITLATTKHPYKTLVIDSFSKLFGTHIGNTEEKMLAANKKVEFSIEKKEAISLTRKLVRWIDKLDMNVILICHQKDQWTKGEVTGQTFDGWEKLEYELHLALQITKQGNSRKARVTKTRLKEFEDGSTFDWSYPSFAKLYGQDAIESESTPIIPATGEQVNRLNTLIDLMHVGTDITDKWKEKAGVETFDEMDTETIQKCIDFLTSRIPANAAKSA